MALEKKILVDWDFALGEKMDCLIHSKKVCVPHTWNIEEGTEEFYGTAWYEKCINRLEQWKDKCLRLYFHGVYHSAEIYINDCFVYESSGSGYTPFEVEIPKHLQQSSKLDIKVKVNNCFTSEILPVERSFDWANDGGIIRKVELLVTGNHYFDEVIVTADPIILTDGTRQDNGSAVWGAKIKLKGKEELVTVSWCLYKNAEIVSNILEKGKEKTYKNEIDLNNRIVNCIQYWHFDEPNLYTLQLSLFSESGINDQKEITFGFRRIYLHGKQLFLNGESVRLCGAEWMPGSDPNYGMAESKQQIHKMLEILKSTNSILTRFHWQQDEEVFNWCDRNGILVQEEVPFWGRVPEAPTEKQFTLFRQQMKDMVKAHRNHPSIIAWGVGNELDGQNDITIQYVKDAVAYTHQMDPTRFVNYISNSYWVDPSRDATCQGDIMMVNDYIGTWHQAISAEDTWDKMIKCNPGKPIIPSEFGLCEPKFTGGDVRRTSIFLEKMRIFRKYSNVVGTIYFCLNDYRTQMGEDGKGRLRKRVHGSTDLYGNTKPSYEVVQSEYCPIYVELDGEKLKLKCKDDIPSYSIKNYYIYIEYLDSTAQSSKIDIPFLLPGESTEIVVNQSFKVNKISVYRPNGQRVYQGYTTSLE